jgi:hypothetical protein
MMKKLGVLLSIGMLVALPGCGCWKDWGCGKNKEDREERRDKKGKHMKHEKTEKRNGRTRKTSEEYSEEK